MRLLVSSCVALLVISATAHAQTTAPADPQAGFSPMPPEPEGVTLTPFLGVGFAGDFENTPAAFGAALGYGMNSNLAVEGEVYFAPGGTQGVLEEFDSSVWSLGANVLYHFRRDDDAAVTPYATAGIGVMNVDAEAEGLGTIEDDTRTDFAWNWGAGLKTAMSERFGLRADLRYVNAGDLTPDHWRLYGGVVIRHIGR